MQQILSNHSFSVVSKTFLSAIMLILSYTSVYANCDTSTLAAQLAENYENIQIQEQEKFQPLKQKVEKLGAQRGWSEQQTQTYLAETVLSELRPNKKQRKRIGNKIKKVAFKIVLGDKSACQDLYAINDELTRYLEQSNQKWLTLNTKIDGELQHNLTQ